MAMDRKRDLKLKTLTYMTNLLLEQCQNISDADNLVTVGV
jgi:hypothetical protein